MKCPACPDTTLVMADRQGVEIDYCPACRGIWLDRGELDKLLDRAAAATSAAAPPPAPASQQHRRPDFEDSDYRHGRPHTGHPRKKSWLNDFFD
jgi:Zn-finger nucleic acid-binding protein